MKLWNRLMCYARRRSPWLFHMNSGSCNGCDIEIVAALSPRYDAEQLGVRLEGSPRHADILCVTGPVTRRAVDAVRTVYSQVLGPKAVIAIGSCPATPMSSLTAARWMGRSTSTSPSMSSFLAARPGQTPSSPVSPGPRISWPRVGTIRPRLRFPSRLSTRPASPRTSLRPRSCRR